MLHPDLHICPQRARAGLFGSGSGAMSTAIMVQQRLQSPHDAPRARSLPIISRSEEHTSELQSLMRISYAVFCLKKKRYRVQHEIDSNILQKRTTPNRSALPNTNRSLHI